MKRTWLTLTAALALFVLPTGCSQDELPAPAPVRPVEFPDPEPEPDPDTIPDTTFDPDYESSDFSEDGKAVLLQRATEGRGIDIVLMGDAFSDRLVANGVYMQKMRQAADAFFSEEPYRSFRHLFNVFAVKAVSRHEAVSERHSTALGVSFGEGRDIRGNVGVVLDYARRVPSLRNSTGRLDELLVVVIVNQVRWAGTCHMWGPKALSDASSPLEGDYGRGFSIAYCAYADVEDWIYVVIHEAAGHGFAKLADEYIEPGYTTAIPDDRRTTQIRRQQYGYSRNVDYRGDRTQCAWLRYLDDPRYAESDLGYYEGGDGYPYGVWRSSHRSLMRQYDAGGFNPVSREAIYRRIHKLAYGEGWVFDYETFAAFDAPNRRRAATRVLRPQPSDRLPLPAPQWIDRSRPLL